MSTLCPLSCGPKATEHDVSLIAGSFTTGDEPLSRRSPRTPASASKPTTSQRSSTCRYPWMLTGYFDSIPRELDEAAKVD
ncbi:hypothetical protein, partial [Streptomyces sp. NPDC096068]|uniref:hypothetical protein n=1 Tax=Streptomyces sp. NPDC096068 TaxID=3155424 RepID=UPI003328E89A